MSRTQIVKVDIQRSRHILLVSLAGIASLGVSLFGSMLGIWSGGKDPNDPWFALLWISSLFSLPIFLLHFASHRSSRILSILLALTIYAAFVTLALSGCMRSECDTASRLDLFIAPLSQKNAFWAQLLACLCINFTDSSRKTAAQT